MERRTYSNVRMDHEGWLRKCVRVNRREEGELADLDEMAGRCRKGST